MIINQDGDPVVAGSVQTALAALLAKVNDKLPVGGTLPPGEDPMALLVEFTHGINEAVCTLPFDLIEYTILMDEERYSNPQPANVVVVWRLAEALERIIRYIQQDNSLEVGMATILCESYLGAILITRLNGQSIDPDDLLKLTFTLPW